MVNDLLWSGDPLDVPMVFRGSREWVSSLNHPCLDEFIAKLPPGDCLIDTRSHILKRGMYPCIPNWHLDYIARGRDGRLRLDDPSNAQMFHIIAFIGPAPTEVAVEPVAVSDIGSWSELDVDGPTTHVAERRLHRLEWNTAHRGTMAGEAGKRLFMRASFGVEGKMPANELRKQVQVYVEGGYGW